MQKIPLLITLWLCAIAMSGEIHITIADPQTWTVSELTPYVGKTVIFDQPMYVTSNYSTYYVSPRTIFYPTNQARPLTEEYYNIATLNAHADIAIYDIDGYHRMNEKIYNLKAEVRSSSLRFVSGEWRENSRQDLIDSLPNVDIVGMHDILVCAMNLEYYLVNPDDHGYSSMGPSSDAEHQRQRAKVSKALARINADLYGLVEVQDCDSAMQELANDLSRNTGRSFTYVTEGGECSGTYTKSGILYCSDVLEPASALIVINTGVANRKKMMTFREKRTGERFTYSINHFKAKSGTGSGADADQGDGQAGFNATRVKEAEAVVNRYNQFKLAIKDDDILFMGDLNAYAKEDPIMVFEKAGMIDLHRTFHQDSSYSYNYHGVFGYLDHAISNTSLMSQITGMAAYHINSDERDSYTYDQSYDTTMFRSSDHDPIIVGLHLDSTLTYEPGITINSLEVLEGAPIITISNAHQTSQPSYYQIYTIDGRIVEEGSITSERQEVPTPAHAGAYIIMVYDDSTVHKYKIIVP